MSRGKSKPGLHPDKPCEWCKDIFSPKRKHTRFCGTKCQAAFARDKKKKEAAERKSEWQKERKCVICKKPYMPNKEIQECCSPKCNDKKGKMRAKEKLDKYRSTIVRKCAHKPCGKEFTPNTRMDQIYCSKDCTDRAGRQFWKDRNPEYVLNDNRIRNRKRYQNDSRNRELIKARSNAAYHSLSTEQKQERGKRNRANADQDNKRKYFREYHKVRTNNDETFKLWSNLRARLRGWFKAENAEKFATTGELVGCTREEFRAHIEDQWLEGMNWDNYGEWHVDHIKPLSWFDPHIPEEAQEALNWKNCQPMWSEDNLRKGNRRSGS